MATKKSVNRLWLHAPSGLIVPGGIASQTLQTSSQTFLDVKAKALAVEALYDESGIRLPASSDLARLIADAKALADRWLAGRQPDANTASLLFRGLMLDGIADPVLMLRSTSERARFLSLIASGTLDLFDRTPSQSKSALWEVELWAMLKGRGFKATLQEPPDIVVEVGTQRVGIACKKLYSERHVQNVLSEAVAQIEPTFDVGIVALNIDELTPALILTAINEDAMSRRISDLNVRFINRHERHFRKYLVSGRAVCALVSTRCLVDVRTARVRISNARQSTVWTIPGLAVDKDRVLTELYEGLMA
jgi:hypothetical protein